MKSRPIRGGGPTIHGFVEFPDVLGRRFAILGPSVRNLHINFVIHDPVEEEGGDVDQSDVVIKLHRDGYEELDCIPPHSPSVFLGVVNTFFQCLCISSNGKPVLVLFQRTKRIVVIMRVELTF